MMSENNFLFSFTDGVIIVSDTLSMIMYLKQ